MCRLRLREGEDAVYHRPPCRLGAVREEGIELTRTSQSRAVDGEITEEEVGDDDLSDVALCVAETDERAPGAKGTQRTGPGRTADAVDHSIHRPDAFRPGGVAVVGTVRSSELPEPVELLRARARRHDPTAQGCGDLNDERRDSTSPSGDQDRLSRRRPRVADERAPGRQPGDRQSRGLRPRPSGRLREEQAGGNNDALCVRPLARNAEDLEIRSRDLVVVTPCEARIDDDL